MTPPNPYQARAVNREKTPERKCFKSVETNRRPAPPVGAGQQSDVSSCEPPSLSAAVAHLAPGE
jgi:hypothetical protein